MTLRARKLLLISRDSSRKLADHYRDLANRAAAERKVDRSRYYCERVAECERTVNACDRALLATVTR